MERRDCSVEEVMLKSISTSDNLDLDTLLPTIGQFGRYQKLLLWLVCLPACIPCGLSSLNQLFMTNTPHEYWCAVPELIGKSNLSVSDRRNVSIPFDKDNGRFSRCSRFAVDWQAVLNAVGDGEELVANASWPVEYCNDGWEYNTTEVYSSIVIDFDLVCDRDIYPTIGLAALKASGPFGVYMFGVLNDRVGRRLSYFCCLATLLIGNLLTVISPNFWTWATSRLIVGLTIPAVYQIPFIIALELVGPDYRTLITMLACAFFTSGLMILAGVSYLIRDWIIMGLVTTLPFWAYFGYFFVLPESPRWLLTQGRLVEATDILKTIARVNRHQLPADFQSDIESRVQLNEKRKKPTTFGALDLCRTPNMRLKTILISLNWCACITVYVGLSLMGPMMGSNQYLSFFLSAFVELPSFYVCYVVMDRWGRRWPFCIYMMLGGLSCISAVVVDQTDGILTMALYLLAKFFITASFMIIYPWAGELYPTEVRGVGIATSSYIGGMGLISIPFVTYMGKENLQSPMIVMGGIIAICGVLGLRLPETLHQRLPQTLSDGEEFGKDWSFGDCLSCIRIKPAETHLHSSYEKLEVIAKD